MIHSHIRLWVHLIWTTKNHVRVFNDDLCLKVASHLIDKAKDEKIPFLSLNVQPEHVHGLINLPSDVCLADFMQKIKDESAYWLNQNDFFPEKNTKFSWQRGYGAFGVGASQLDVIRDYIKDQSAHHKHISFMEEYIEWKREYGIED